MKPNDRSLPACALAMTLALCACSHAPRPVAPSAVAAPENPIDRAVALLDQGDEDGARKALKPLLKRTPNDPEANVLIASMDQDAVTLLGPKAFPYKTAPGDTMIGLSQRFLGNRLMFYELSRYNAIKVPATLAAGTMLRIPGEPPRPPQGADTPAPPRAPAAKPARKLKAQPAATPPAAASHPAAQAADPAAAMRLRGAALAALNQGKADQATALLRRAATLAPGNALIARDLARAERIAATVRARR